MRPASPLPRYRLTAVGVFFATLCAGPCLAGTASKTITGCDYYAAPAGTGDGLSLDGPFNVADFWPVAAAGKTLCLTDGVYADSAGMINPPDGLSGLSGAPITVRAIHDGGVLITGQTDRLPISLTSNDWVVVEGVNACCSSATVVGLSHSNYNVIRRVAAWDAAEGNNDIFGIHYGTHNLLEDVAGWGVARKIYESSQGGDFTTIRRSWGRWEGSHVIGPKMVYTLAYNNYNMLVENAIGTWSGERMKATYVLLDYQGKPWTGSGGGTYTGYQVNQPYGVFSTDTLTGDKNAQTKLLGSLAYVGKTDVFKADREVFITNIDSVEIHDTVAVFGAGGTYAGKQTFGLYGLTTSLSNGGEKNVQATSLTSIIADSLGNRIGSGWQQTNIFQGTDIASLATANSAYPGVQGADLCHQYVDGTLTTRPLWPWPMNGRIRDAMVQSGRASVDVTKTVEGLLGPIPDECRSADLLLPVVGHVQGAGGEVFVTDFHIFNPSTAASAARLLFQPMGRTQPYRVNVEIGPGQTLNSADSVQMLFGLDSAIGSLVLESNVNGDDTLRTNARIFAARPSGTLGLAMTSSKVSASPASSSVFVTGLAATDAFRSNLGVINTTDAVQIFKIVLRSPGGSVLYVTPAMRLNPGIPSQWAIGTLFPAANGMGLLAEFRPQEGTTVPDAYGTLVDNVSGDSTFHPAMAPLSTLYLPAIGNITGASGLFLTDLSISNTSDAGVTMQATFLDHDVANTSPKSLSRTLEAHTTLRMADALKSLFDLTESFGALRLTTQDASAVLVATARVYSPSLTTGGTVGQQINAITTADLRTTGSLLGLEQDSRFRSNVAFLNPGSSSVRLDLDLRDAQGQPLATSTLTLAPASYTQRAISALFPGTVFPAGAPSTLSFRSPSDGVFAFASVIDNSTGDPSFFPSVP